MGGDEASKGGGVDRGEVVGSGGVRGVGDQVDAARVDAVRGGSSRGGAGDSAGELLEPEELRALVHLRSLPGLTDGKLRGLLSTYGSAAAVLRAPASELGEKAARARGTRPVMGRVERALRTIGERGIEVLVERDPRYPVSLRELTDPPPLLFALGQLELLDRPALAIVGARQPTAYGKEAARVLAYGVARAGVVVVSGMARGIDGIAHRAALDAEGGTIGVLGCGIDVIYPREHERLFEWVATRGLLLSEFVPGEPPERYHFPRRNRLIAALAAGVLVVEASRRSGSLITADHAADLGRDVLAVPGPIGLEASAGNNELIRDGATVVLEVSDALAVVGIDSANGEAGTPPWPHASLGAERSSPVPPPPELEGETLALWRVLSDEPRHAEVLAAACGLDPARALVQLLALELGGHARQLAGLRFVRLAAALALD